MNGGRERERERERGIYIYIYRERERERGGGGERSHENGENGPADNTRLNNSDPSTCLCGGVYFGTGRSRNSVSIGCARRRIYQIFAAF